MNGSSAHGTKMKNMFVKEKQWWMGQNKMDKGTKGPGKDIRAECCINKERDSPNGSSGWEDSYRCSDERSVTALIDNSRCINNIFRLGSFPCIVSKYPRFLAQKYLNVTVDTWRFQTIGLLGEGTIEIQLKDNIETLPDYN